MGPVYLGLGETSLSRLRSPDLRTLLLLGTAVLGLACPFLLAPLGGGALAGATLEERKLPMKFSFVACQLNCRGWISAVGVVTADSPKDFEEFERGRDLRGATLVLDSSGGSVNDSIALGRRFRELGLLTTVGVSVVALYCDGVAFSLASTASVSSSPLSTKLRE